MKKFRITKKSLISFLIFGGCFALTSAAMANYLYYNADNGFATFSNNVSLPGLYSSGNVGIGTTNPGAPLSFGSSFGAPKTYLFDDGTYVAGFGSYNPDTMRIFGDSVNKKITLGSQTRAGAFTEWMRLDNGNVGIGTANPDAKLDVLGATVNSNGLFTHYQNLASYSGSINDTGTKKITLPRGWTNTMISVTIKGYDYSAAGSWEVIVSGYNYAASPVWVNTSAEVRGKAPFNSVRLGYDGTNMVILLGITSTVWQYPKIEVSDCYAGYSNITGWGSGWTITNITSETGITNIDTPTVPIYTDSTGKVGIGTTNPSQALSVNGNAYISGTVTAGGFSGPLTGTLSSANVSSGAFGSNTGGGNYSFPANVGIGTAGPTQKLEVNGNVLITGANPYLSLKDTATWGSNFYLQSGVTNTGSAGGDYTIFYNPAGKGFSWTQSNVSKMVMDTSGNVGIGTTNPGAVLHTKPGAVAITGLANAVSNSSAFFEAGGGPSWGLSVGYVSNAIMSLQTVDKAQTSGSTLALNPYGGNVGIGTTNPGAKLEIFDPSQTENANGLVYINKNWATNQPAFVVRQSGAGGNPGTLQGMVLDVAGTPLGKSFEIQNSGTARVTVYNNGNTTFTGTVTAGGFSGPLTGTITAGNVSSGTFGSNTGGGNYHFPGNIYTDADYGYGLVGVYSSVRYQGVFAMGDSYKLSSDGTTPGNLYGIAWTHENIGGQSKSGLGHQALFMTNGITQTAIGSGVWTNGSITSGGNVTANNYSVVAGNGNGLKFWNGSDSYKISMGNAAENHYGPVIDYSIKTNIDSNGSTRGFTWGENGVTPIAALNVGNGNMQIAGTMTAGGFSGPLTGTLSSANVSSGAFGSNTGGGNYSFPGNVGIGTTNPAGKLEMAFNYGFNLRPSAPPYTGGFRWDTIGNETMIIGVKNTSTKIMLATGYDILASQGSTQALPTSPELTISNGNVGIGTTNPGAKLDVTGNINASSFTTSGPIYRSVAGAGYLNGQYSSVETTNTSGAIYSIGGSYVPGVNNLGNMYGIGYGYSGGGGITFSGLPNNLWGMYVASGGAPSIFLSSGEGKVYAASALFSGTVTAGGFSGPLTGTLSSANVSSGAFGSNTGGGNYSFPASVGIGTTNPGVKLDVNGQINGVLANRQNTIGTRIYNPPGAMYTAQTPVQTGAIAVTMPKMPDVMVSFWVDVYDYGSNTSFSVFVSGYPYSSAGVWSYASAMILGSANRQFNVRFGGSNDNTKSIIYIGETNSTWSYPQVMVRDVLIGYNAVTANVDNLNWAISYETTLLNVHVTRSDVLPYASIVTTAAQPNITSLGTLTGLDVAGNTYLHGGWFETDGATYLGWGNNPVHTYGNTYLAYSTGNVGIGTASPGYKLDVAGSARVSGDLHITGAVYMDGADLSEGFSVQDQVEPGDVVMINTNKDEVLHKANVAYSQLVAGVVSTKPAIKLGKQDETQVALSGTTPVKVCDEGGAIRPGDILTSSSLPGYAMKCAAREKCSGAIIGKALESFDNGRGMIKLLISLQ